MALATHTYFDRHQAFREHIFSFVDPLGTSRLVPQKVSSHVPLEAHPYARLLLTYEETLRGKHTRCVVGNGRTDAADNIYAVENSLLTSNEVLHTAVSWLMCVNKDFGNMVHLHR